MEHGSKGTTFAADVPEKYMHHFEEMDTNQVKKFAIAHFEMIAIVATLNTMRSQIGTGIKLLLRCDSKHVEAAIKNKSSKDAFLMAAVRWLCMHAAQRALRRLLKTHACTNR